MAFHLRAWYFIAAVLMLAASLDADELPPPAARTVSFREDVLPILQRRCFECHAGRDASSGHRLDDRAELLGETSGEPYVDVGRSADSRLVHLIAGRDPDRVMPPEGERLSSAEIGVLRAWIDQGLNWDAASLPPARAEVDHWAFRPVARPAIPSPQNREWVENPVDAFLAVEHERRGLAPAGPASRRVLIRRLSLDLRGFPPSPEEVESFLADPSPTAYETLVERMLASPHYGERWGRHWLDVVRWAESEGFESNHPRDFAWRYRDYVVQSFNADKPFDEFIRQQLAGDELTPYSDENLIATGFLAAARLSSNEEDKWLQRNTVLVDIVNATGSAFLGLTINCAQCHNHKFDPITARDYYRLLGFFLPGQPVNVELQGEEVRREYEAERPEEYEPALALQQALFEKAHIRLTAEVRKQLSPAEQAALATPRDERSPEVELLARQADLKLQFGTGQIEKYISDEDRKLYDELKRKIAAIEKTCPPRPQTWAYYSPVTSPHRLTVLPMKGFYPLPFDVEELRRQQPYIQVRGDVHNIGPLVEAGFPEVFDAAFSSSLDEDVVPPIVSTVAAAGGATAAAPRKNSPRRTRSDLAAWLTDPRHPLTARVWVNRIWHYHFGRGLVGTPGDFGLQGEAPSHGELLDWLASELISSGWSTKQIQRLILTSNAYRQSSAADPRCAAIDPENRYLWHWAPRRLESEAIRDAMLAVSGELDWRLGGASVPADESEMATRRSLYLFQKRGLPPQMQSLFDGPSEVAESCSRRHTSTTALQPLYLLNNQFALKRAAAVAELLLADDDADQDRRITTAFERILGRLPDDMERAAAGKFFESHPAGATTEDGRRAALVQFCQALLNLNEFVYLE